MTFPSAESRSGKSRLAFTTDETDFLSTSDIANSDGRPLNHFRKAGAVTPILDNRRLPTIASVANTAVRTNMKSRQDTAHVGVIEANVQAGTISTAVSQMRNELGAIIEVRELR
jgi:hypothetical protein